MPDQRSAFDAKPADPTACDLELVRVMYEILARQSDCVRCGAALHPEIEVGLTRRMLIRARIVAATFCAGPTRHRHVATVVVERAGGLGFGQLLPRSGR